VLLSFLVHTFSGPYLFSGFFVSTFSEICQIAATAEVGGDRQSVGRPIDIRFGVDRVRIARRDDEGTH
jgi:hypothetical protein